MDIALHDNQELGLPLVTEHQPVEFVFQAPYGAWLELSVDHQLLEPFLRPGDSNWRWRWNPGPAVGLHQVALVATAGGESERRSWQLRVVPRKIDQERYEALIEDIQRLAYNIAYTLAGAGAEGAALEREAPWERSRLEEYYAIFEARLGPFVSATRRIATRPREQLRGGSEELLLGQASGLDNEALIALPRGMFDEAPEGVGAQLQEALRTGGGLLPRSVPAARSGPTFDFYEHRLLKQLLAVLWRRARFIGALAQREVERLEASEGLTGVSGARLGRARQIAAGCEESARTLRELRGLPFLTEVRPLLAFRGATQLLQRDPAYREVYRMWQALRQHPYVAFDSPLFAIPIADLPRLYEAWCALQTARALLELGGELREQQLVARQRPAADEDLVVTVGLVEDGPLLVVALGETVLRLRYQPRYTPRSKNMRRSAPGAGDVVPTRPGSLDRYTHVPDLAIEVEQPGAPWRVLVLDAKYRLDAEGRGVPPDALADAYTYLGAIGWGEQRAVLAALLLFPGRGEAEIYPSGVGSVPLRPGGDELANVLRIALGLHERP